MNILVTGGAGYIGSMMTKMLVEKKHDVVVFDNLSTGNRNAIDPNATFVEGDLGDLNKLDSMFNDHSIDAVIHFAGVLLVKESMEDPAKYFRGNLSHTLNLLEAMRTHSVGRIVFSSTAGVYGNPTHVPIPEDHTKKPTHVYGHSKYMTEQILEWYGSIYGLKSICLRYFNAAGASLDRSIGELHANESHIIPLAMKAAIHTSEFILFGTDYETKDGTCVRDYIHIEDLCDAHIRALSYSPTDMHSVFNVGTGTGYTNREVLAEIERTTQKKILISETERRAGDPSELVADARKIEKELGWKPQHSDLKTIVQTAWDFHSKHGFGS